MDGTQLKLDRKYIRRCFALAIKAGVRAYPNPMVGAVIVKDGRIIGEGYHRFCGADHAEVDAIKNCKEDPRGSTIYINLEPCNHHGRTPPCTHAILRAGISRVVYATKDNNPMASGGGIALSENGVEVTSGLLDDDARDFNSAFFISVLCKRPQITLKVAQTVNAKIARSDGTSKWITCDNARRDVHLERSRNQAILVGKRTLLHDNPRLSVRHVKGDSPIPVVLDAKGDSPKQLEIFKDKRTLMYTERVVRNDLCNVIHWDGHLSRQSQWEFMLSDLYAKGIISLYVEGGGQIASFLLESHLVDFLHIYIGPNMFASNGIDGFMLNRELNFQLKSSKKIGQSVKLIYKRAEV